MFYETLYQKIEILIIQLWIYDCSADRFWCVLPPHKRNSFVIASFVLIYIFEKYFIVLSRFVEMLKMFIFSWECEMATQNWQSVSQVVLAISDWIKSPERSVLFKFLSKIIENLNNRLELKV